MPGRYNQNTRPQQFTIKDDTIRLLRERVPSGQLSEVVDRAIVRYLNSLPPQQFFDELEYIENDLRLALDRLKDITKNHHSQA